MFVIVTVFTAGMESIQMWLAELALPETTTAQAFSLKLNCVLAGVMLVLSAVVALDAARRWYVLLVNGAGESWGRGKGAGVSRAGRSPIS